MTRSRKQISVELLRLMEKPDPLFNLAGEMEAPITELQNRAKIMFMILGEMDDDDGLAVYQLACDVKTATAKLSDIHGRLFRMTHPDPAVRAKGRRRA